MRQHGLRRRRQAVPAESLRAAYGTTAPSQGAPSGGCASMLISVHLPKTAGSSLKHLLEQRFGSLMLPDYQDFPLNTPRPRRLARALFDCARTAFDPPQADCIHGHFMPLKYRLLATRRRIPVITWMRDPVERLASHYYYWIRNYNPERAGALRRRVVEEGWSIERFCLGPELRNVYGQVLIGYPLQRFEFIGITEHFEADLHTFCHRYLGTAPTASTRNVNPDRDAAGYFVSASALRKRIARHHASDMEMYDRALRMRALRASKATTA
jgi:hypothetical protein